MNYDIVTATCSAFYRVAQRLFLFLFGQTFLHCALNQAFGHVVGKILGSAMGVQLFVFIQNRRQLLQPVALHCDLHTVIFQRGALACVHTKKRGVGKPSRHVLGKLTLSIRNLIDGKR